MRKPYYQDDAVTIYCGDCREIVPELGRFDLLLTDPPYGIGADMAAHKASGCVVGHGHRRVAKRVYPRSEWDSAPIDGVTLAAVMASCGSQIIWGGNYFELPPCKGPLVWDKQNDGNNFADAELAWNNLGCPVRIKRHLWNGMARKGSEIRYDHPTQKPIELMTWCIGLAGDVQTILDPFAGSGTTGRAAKDLGRKAVLIEREERYCEMAAKRMAQEVLAL
jgi:DNA modification methylase